MDQSIVWWLDDNKVYWHESVGTIVIVKNKMLTLLRQIYPFCYTIPAGHLDKDDSPEVAAKRELLEETGIELGQLEPFSTNFDMAGDSCRRGSDHHRWHLYRARIADYPNIQLSDEASQVKWMTLQELKDEPQLTYPLKFFVDTFGKTMF